MATFKVVLNCEETHCNAPAANNEIPTREIVLNYICKHDSNQTIAQQMLEQAISEGDNDTCVHNLCLALEALERFAGMFTYNSEIITSKDNKLQMEIIHGFDHLVKHYKAINEEKKEEEEEEGSDTADNE